MIRLFTTDHMVWERRVALFFPTFTPGGIERVLLILAREFNSRGIRVHILVADRRGELENQVPDDVRVVDLEAGRVARSLLPLRTYLATEHPDVLLSGHSHANLVCICASMLTRSNITTAVGVHTTESVRLYQGVSSRIISLLIPWAYRHADHVIAVSEGTAADLSSSTRISSDRISVIPNPVAQPSDDVEVDVHPWIEEQDKIVILGAGRLVPTKDFSTLIRGFEKIHQKRPDARLIILGEGKQRPKLESLVSRLDLDESVNLPGFVDNPTPYMAGSDVFVLCSRREGFGLVLVEAMAVGTPVVATNCPSGPAEILGEGRYGRLVPPGDVESLAEAIEGTLQVPKKPQELMQRAEDFAPTVVADQYLKMFYCS